MSDMTGIKSNQVGILNVLIFPLITLTVLFLAVSGFAIWAYSQRSHYKNQSDQIVTAAVQQAIQKQQTTDNVKYTQASKLPYATYVGPSAYGSINVQYPKTWSAYVIESQNNSGSNPINGYFEPGFVPDTTNSANTFALRVELVSDSYSTVVSQFQSQLQSQTPQITVVPYSLPKVPSVVGVRVDGQITPTQQGSMIVLPLRNLTLEVWTESNNFKSDFNNNILPNLSFAP